MGLRATRTAAGGRGQPAALLARRSVGSHTALHLSSFLTSPPDSHRRPSPTARRGRRPARAGLLGSGLGSFWQVSAPRFVRTRRLAGCASINLALQHRSATLRQPRAMAPLAEHWMKRQAQPPQRGSSSSTTTVASTRRPGRPAVAAAAPGGRARPRPGDRRGTDGASDRRPVVALCARPDRSAGARPQNTPRGLPDLPPTTLGRFSLLQKQLQALDEAAANEKRSRRRSKTVKGGPGARPASTKAKSYRREAALAAVVKKD